MGSVIVVSVAMISVACAAEVFTGAAVVRCECGGSPRMTACTVMGVQWCCGCEA